MDRERATRQIERIIRTIEGEDFPARVKELYVFGSYARGALNPGDLDLIVIHEPASPDFLSHLREQIEETYGEDDFLWPRGVSPEHRFESMITRAVRRPGEKMDILLATSMGRLLGMGDNIAKAHRVLLWSDTDRDWQPKVTSIKPDPAAGRFERGHFASLKRFRGSLRSMINVSEAVDLQLLRLARLDAAEVEPELNPVYQYWFDWWVECKVMGKDSMKILRHGLWWMQQQRGQAWHRPHPPRHEGIMCSEDWKYAVYFGQPPLNAVYRVCEKEHRYVRICLIPHFKRDEKNEMFIFEKGDKFSQKRLDALLNRTGW